MMLAAFEPASRGGERGPQFIFPLIMFLLLGFIVKRNIGRIRPAGARA